MVEELNGRKVEILRLLLSRSVEGRAAPSLREIAAAVGFKSSRSAHVNLLKLEEAGYVEREDGHARGVRLTGKGRVAALGETSVVGSVVAGFGEEAVTVRDEAYSLAAELLMPGSGRERYLLKVVGQSMSGAGIEDGDVLVVEVDESPPDGAVVVAMLRGGEEATVKRFRREGALVRLKPQNGDHEEVVVPADEVRIQGRVVYVVHPPR